LIADRKTLRLTEKRGGLIDDLAAPFFTGGKKVYAAKPVGASLLAKASGQSNHLRLKLRFREQARSHINSE